MTLEEIKKSEKDVLSPADICGVLGVDKYSINVAVKEDKKQGINSFSFSYDTHRIKSEDP